jgi:hypothetical protein
VSGALPALRQLELLADAVKARKHPNLPEHARVKSKYTDATANDLTRCLVDFFELQEHFATRLASTGTYREDLKCYVPSQQVKGMPDVLACVAPFGRLVAVEVKIGRDRLSNDQKATIAVLRASGALVYVATDFQGFYEWIVAQIPALRIGLIPRLKTPDLPKLPRPASPSTTPDLFQTNAD